jgi:hypothetical protein
VATTLPRRTIGERRLLGSLAPVSRTMTAATTQQTGSVPASRRSITDLITSPVRTAATVPTTSYIPGTDVSRVAGFYNPQNPYDTGRSGEKNPELARAAGLEQFEDLPGWDYDLGRPMNVNAKLNSEGYYSGLQGLAPGGGGSSSDPMLQKIRALSQQSLSNARSQAAALRKQAAIDTGDENIAKEIGLDETTLAAVAANPFSRRKNFLNDALAAETELEQGLNADNLFYSGHRVNQLSELGRKRAEGETTIGSDLRSQLALIDQNLAEAEYQAQLQELEAQRQAMLDALMYGGYGGGGGGEEQYEEPYAGSYFVPQPYVDRSPDALGWNDQTAEQALASLLKKPAAPALPTRWWA